MSNPNDPHSTSAERPIARRKSDDAIETIDAESADTMVVTEHTAETAVRLGDGSAADATKTSKSGKRRYKRDTSDILPEGMRIGNYVIEAAHSRGGFATVYKAMHEKIGRPVALKVLHSQLATTPNIVKRFEQEARAVNKIRHPNIVDITDYGELADGRPFFVMEWLDGATLKQLVHQRGALSQDDALRICEDVCPALSAAHEHQIVHRDLKLSNVIGVPKGDWYLFKLLDFGIAKVLHPDGLTDGLLTTMTGNRVGSPLTMAPEQIRCQQVDPRTDIYALGVMLFEIVTGKPPYDGKTPMEVEKLHLRAPVPDASELAPVHPSVAAVISRCMQKAQEDRYPSVNDVLLDMRKAVVDPPGDPTIPQPTLTAESAADLQQGRGKGMWIVLGLVALALIAALIAIAARDSRDDENQAAPLDKQEQPGKTLADPEPTPKPKNPIVPPHRGKVTQLPGTFDPAKLNVTASIAQAEKVARQNFSDAVLVQIDADNVGHDGTANLTLGRNTIVGYEFRSPERSRPGNTVAARDGAQYVCRYYVYADKSGRFYHHARSGNCELPLIGVPKCSAADVWKKAIKSRVPKDLKLATLSYRAGDAGATNKPKRKRKRAHGMWIFSWGTKVERKLPDDCKK